MVMKEIVVIYILIGCIGSGNVDGDSESSVGDCYGGIGTDCGDHSDDNIIGTCIGGGSFVMVVIVLWCDSGMVLDSW